MKPFIYPFGNEYIKLRLLTENDLELIREWRNRDDAKKWFKDSGYITLDQHKHWFEKYIDKENDFHFIVEANKAPVGQASVYNICRTKGDAEIGRFLVAPGHEGKGYIKQACMELIKFCREDLQLRYIFLEVMSNNVKAIALYKNNGFSEETRSDILVRMGQWLT